MMRETGMTVKEIIERKANIEKEILRLLYHYEKVCGVRVDIVYLSRRLDLDGRGRDDLTAVDIVVQVRK